MAIKASTDKRINSLLQGVERKRRHHHVWQRYLAAWTGDDGQLFCLMGDRLFPTGTTAIAVEKDFYRIGTLTPADIALVRLLMIDVKGLHPITRKSHEEFLALVSALALLKGASPDEEELIETARTNALEDYHAGIEGSFLPLLERALKKDLSFYPDGQECITLLYFMAMQHMRTKGIKVRTIEILKEKSGLDASRVWNILSQMASSNIGMTVYLERNRRKLVLIENATSQEFITSDQPIVNLDGRDGKPPDTLCWYYPISPHLALILADVDQAPPFATSSLTTEQVDRLNKKMIAASHSQVFAHSCAAVERYLPRKP